MIKKKTTPAYGVPLIKPILVRARSSTICDTQLKWLTTPPGALLHISVNQVKHPQLMGSVIVVKPSTSESIKLYITNCTTDPIHVPAGEDFLSLIVHRSMVVTMKLGHTRDDKYITEKGAGAANRKADMLKQPSFYNNQVRFGR